MNSLKYISSGNFFLIKSQSRIIEYVLLLLYIGVTAFYIMNYGWTKRIIFYLPKTMVLW